MNYTQAVAIAGRELSMWADVENNVRVCRIHYPYPLTVGGERTVQWWESDDAYTGPTFREDES